MPISQIPLCPVALRDARTPLSDATRATTGIRVADNYRTPVRNAQGRFQPFRWFGDIS